jgi:IBR domain, a half RING-finger domain/Zinc finger, C3HC4 type (RING finger)
MQIDCITTHHESSRIVLKGWPSELTEENIKWYLRSYGKVHFISVTKDDSGEKVAHVRFSQHQEAVAALREIEEGRIELGPWPSRVTAVFDTSIAPTLKGTNILSDTVVLSWIVPKPKLKVFYYTSQKASHWAKRISSWTRDEQQLVAKVRRPKVTGEPARTLIVENLPESINVARFGSQVLADDRPSWLPNYYDHDMVITEVRKVIDSFARDVSVDQYENRVTFRCIFRDSEDTKAFIALVNKQEWRWRASARFQMTQYIDVLYIVSLTHFTAIEQQLNDLRTELGEMKVSMRVTAPPEAGTVRHILISGGLGLRGGKRLMDHLLAGEVVKHEGKVLWDEDVNSFHGPSILADLVVPGTYIFINRRNQSYTVHGPLDKREVAARLLIDRVQRAKTYLNMHEFPRNQLRWWAETGQPLIRERVGAANFWLDPLHCRVTVWGAGPARGILRHCINKARNHRHPPPRPVYGGARYCPACFEKASDPVLIGCKHVYCRDCFTAFLACTARHGDPLPIKCFGDDGKCPQLVSMWAVRKFMQQADLQRLATKVLEMHISRKQDELRYCPTPDCAYIYRVQERITEPPVPEIPKGAKSKQPKGNLKRVDTPSGAPDPKAEIASATIQCPGCLVKICAGCHSAAHDRRTCDSVQAEKENKDKLFQTWLKTSGAKHCPKCSIPLLKDGGCNHVRCGACSTHICWVCLKTFKDEGEKEGVYEHIRREHGGSVFGGMHVVAWEALPEDINEAALLAALSVDESPPRPAPAAPAAPHGDLWQYPPPPPPPSETPKDPLPPHVIHALYRPGRRQRGVVSANQMGSKTTKGQRRLRERGDPTWNPLHFMEYEYPEDEPDDPIVWPKKQRFYEHENPDWWGEYEDYDLEWL